MAPQWFIDNVIDFDKFMEIYSKMNSDEYKILIIQTLFPCIYNNGITWEQTLDVIKSISCFDDKLKVIPIIGERFSGMSMALWFDLLSFGTQPDDKIKIIKTIVDSNILISNIDSDVFITFIKTLQSVEHQKTVFQIMIHKIPYSDYNKILAIIAENDTKDNFIKYCKIIEVKACTCQDIWNSVHKTKDLAIVETHENKPNVVINNVSYCVDFGIPEIIGESFVNEDHSFGNMNTTVIHHILNKKVHCIRSVHKYRLNVKESCVMRGFTVMNKNIHTVEISGYKKISVIAGDSVECKLIRLRIYRNLDTSVYVYDDIIECHELRLDNKIIPDESLTISIN